MAASSSTFCQVFPTGPPPLAILSFDYTDRAPQPEALLLHHLLTETPSTVSLLGPGGVGKTTICQSLSRHPLIFNKFSDGVHHLSLGIHATSATLLHHINNLLLSTGIDANHTDIDLAIDNLQERFRGRAIALFIDDIWTGHLPHHLLFRLCELAGPHTAVILATRETTVASLAPANAVFRVSPGEKRGEHARKILACHAGVQLDAVVDYKVARVLDLCCGLPVCLAAAGKAVRTMAEKGEGEDPWAKYLELPNCREQLLEGDVPDYGNLYVSFQASLALLDNRSDEETQFAQSLTFSEMFRRLCVLQKRSRVPAVALRNLWELSTNNQAFAIAERFVQVGLAEVKVVGNLYDSVKAWYFSMHDTLHDFAVCEAERHGEIAEVHNVLLNEYRNEYPDLAMKKGTRQHTMWWSTKLKPDDYIHKNVCHHLAKSGNVEELVELLQTPCWIIRQLRVNDIWTLEDDFRIGISTLLRIDEEEVSDDITVLRLIREALTLSLSFISKNVEEAQFQLYGRLLAHQDSCEGIRSFLQRMRNTAQKRWLRSINTFLESPGSSTIRMIPVYGVSHMAVLDGTGCVACGCDNGSVVILNIMRGAIETRWKAHNEKVCAIASAKQGTRIVTGGADACAAVWNVKTERFVVKFTDHSSRVNSVVVLTDGQRVASASEDGAIYVWHIETGDKLTAFPALAFAVRRLVAFPDAQHLVSGGADRQLRAWDIASCSQIGDPLPDYSFFINYLAVTPDGSLILSGSHHGKVRTQPAQPVRQIGDTRSVEILIEPDTGVECYSLSEDGRYIVSGHANGKVRLWDAIDGSPLGSTLQGHSDRVRDILVLGSSDVVVSASSDGFIRIWDIGRMTDLSQPPQEERISQVAFTPNGKHVVTGSVDGSLRIWDTASGNQFGQAMMGHAGRVSALALSPEGSRIASVSNDKDRTVRVWDFESQKQIAELSQHSGLITSVALTSYGDHVIAGSLDRNLYVWFLNAESEDEFFFVLKGHEEWVMRMFVSDCGKRVISVGDGGEICQWDIDSRRRLSTATYDFAFEDPLEATREDILRYVNERCISARVDQSSVSNKIKVVDCEIIYTPTVRDRPIEDTDVIGTMECDIRTQAYYPDQNMFCLGLKDGQMALMKLEPAVP